jgi:tetratricopeptide (TPR) repeat protein
MKLSALFILLTIFGSYSGTGVEVSSGAAASWPQNSAPASAVPQPTPRQNAEMRADILDARKEYLAAAHAYEDILKDDPRNASLLNKTGVAYQAMGASELAEHYYKKALRADKNSATALNNLGTLEYSGERYGLAIKYYRKALDHPGERATVYSNLGYAYAASHQYPKALDAFGKALAIDPEFYSHHGGTGPLIEQRTAADPGVLFYLLAKSYARIGDVENTIQYLKKARDDGYKNFAAAAKDTDFAPVIENPRVREALQLAPLPPAGGAAASGKSPS